MDDRFLRLVRPSFRLVWALCPLVAAGCGTSSAEDPPAAGASGGDTGADGGPSNPDGADDDGDDESAGSTRGSATTDFPPDSSDTSDADDSDSGSSGGSQSDPFSFLVFGDLNGGGCEKNDRFNRLVPMMLDAAPEFIVNTGDVIEGFGDASCFGAQPAASVCNDDNESGNMAQQMAPLFEAPRDPELRAAFFPVMGNHDGNWGSGWYPDPCGGGICELLGMDSAGVTETYITHGDTLDAPGFAAHTLNHGDICGLDPDGSGHPEDFYYSFPFRNSYFIMLRLTEDFSGMLDCNGGAPGFDSCAEYCSAPELRLDDARNSNCYSVFQYDWLTAELMAASETYEHIFVFAHAPLMGSGDNHLPNSDAPMYRALFDEYGVSAFFNGHNHAYERTVPVRAGAQDPDGTHYITVGTGGALTDTISGDEFTAHSYQDWTSFGDYEQMTSYVRVSVDQDEVTATVVTLAGDTVDDFQID